MAKFKVIYNVCGKQFRSNIEVENREAIPKKLGHLVLATIFIESVEPEKVEKDTEVLEFFKKILK